MVIAKTLTIGDPVRIVLSLSFVLLMGIYTGDYSWAQPAPRPRPPEDALQRLTQPGATEPEPESAEPADAAPKSDQQFDEDQVDNTQKQQRTKIGQMLRDQQFGPGQQAVFDTYYNDYALPQWTLLKNLGNVHLYRPTLRNELRQAKSGQVHDHLNTLIMEYMKKLATTGNYHPAVRVNAMLMIGELNRVEATGNEMPTPLDEGLQVLIVIVENAKLSDAVRAAAMVGILRHAAAGIRDDEVRKPLAVAMLKLASANIPASPAGPGREWLRSQAIETLGRLGSVGDNDGVFNLLLKNVADSKLSFSTRCIAAESLGRLNYAGTGGISPVDTAAILGQFVIKACGDELRLAKETEKHISRRRMKQRLSAARAAIFGSEENRSKGLASLAREQLQQTFLADFQKTLEATTDKLDDKKLEGDDLETAIDDLRTNIEGWLKKKPK